MSRRGKVWLAVGVLAAFVLGYLLSGWVNQDDWVDGYREGRRVGEQTGYWKCWKGETL